MVVVNDSKKLKITTELELVNSLIFNVLRKLGWKVIELRHHSQNSCSVICTLG